MAHQWLSLPYSWKLQNVQAGINIIIVCLSALGIFVVVQYCWQRAARKVTRNEEVPLPALLSINTLGDVWDTLYIFKGKTLSAGFMVVVVQCFVVVSLSAIGIASGPLARYACRLGSNTVVRNTLGHSAHGRVGDIADFSVAWDSTIKSLDRAEFPLNQLLDYLPDSSVDWRYREEEWNNTWSMACNTTDSTPISLQMNNNCSESGLFAQVEGYKSVFDTKAWSNSRYSTDTWSNGTIFSDLLWFIYGYHLREHYTFRHWSMHKGMNMSLVVIHMHNVPENSSHGDCRFGPGELVGSSYTKIDCVLDRKAHVHNPLRIAYPDVNRFDVGALVTAYATFYNSRLIRESAAKLPITTITPNEIIRFYQSYFIVKDTLMQNATIRPITQERSVVQISLVFVVISTCVLAIILAGGLQTIILEVKYRYIFSSIPRSKVDWMMQSIQNPSRPSVDSKGRHRWSVTADAKMPLATMGTTKRKRNEFSSAKYRSISVGGDDSPSLMRYPSLRLTPTHSRASSQQDGYSVIGLGFGDEETPLVRPTNSVSAELFGSPIPAERGMTRYG